MHLDGDRDGTAAVRLWCDAIAADWQQYRGDQVAARWQAKAACGGTAFSARDSVAGGGTVIVRIRCGDSGAVARSCCGGKAAAVAARQRNRGDAATAGR